MRLQKKLLLLHFLCEGSSILRIYILQYIMHFIHKRLLFLCFCACITTSSSAQSSRQNSENSIELTRMINVYHSWAGSQDPVYNGREYERFAFYINSGIPYFVTDTLANAKLVYDGIEYYQTPLLYDLIADELITKSYDGKNLIKLVKQKVDSFNLNGARFICIHRGESIPEGYYRLLHDGSTPVLKKEVRRIENDIKYGEQMQKNIKSKTTYYIKENDQYRKVTNAGIIRNYGQLTQ